MELFSNIFDLLELFLCVFKVVNLRLPNSFFLFGFLFLFLLLNLIIMVHGFQSFVFFAKPVQNRSNYFEPGHFGVDRFLFDLVDRGLETLLDLVVIVFFL